MGTEPISVQEIPVGLLEPHPENSNFMNGKLFEKLCRHIEQTGRYEPLTVRPHPGHNGKFQVINGHNRLKALLHLHSASARCIVWNIDDRQTRIYLATLNRLTGTDVAERRAVLLGNLLETCAPQELSLLLPEDAKQIEELAALCRLDEHPRGAPSDGRFQVPVILSFALEEQAAQEVNQALDLIQEKSGMGCSRGDALTSLARSYLVDQKAYSRG